MTRPGHQLRELARAKRRHVIGRWGRYQEAVDQGLNVTDPDVREELEPRV